MFLNCHTGYSFKYGTLPPRQLFSEARRCGIRKLVITEINNTGSYMELLRICDRHTPHKDGLTKFGDEGYQLDIAVGIEFRRDDRLCFIAIAQNNNGFETLNRFLSTYPYSAASSRIGKCCRDLSP
jgi:DNA polymerase III alpha subunit